jgi:trk system potassium uptake protein TrkH
VNYRLLSLLISKYYLFLSKLLLIPLIFALLEHWKFLAQFICVKEVLGFFYAQLIASIFGGIHLWIGRGEKLASIRRKEGFLGAVLIWVIAGVIGAIPFHFSGELSLLDAFFEAISGITTTGASVISPTYHNPLVPDKMGVEAWSRSLLLWRALLQWLGGMGILLLLVAVLPSISLGGRSLYEAESGGTARESILPKVRDSAKNLWKVYLGGTLLGIILVLVLAPKVPWFDAILIMMCSISTAGFSATNSSISYYQCSTLEWLVIIFMIIGSLNFSLYFYALKQRWREWLNKELLGFIGIILVGGGIVAWGIYGAEYQQLVGKEGVYGVSDAIRHGYFHYISAQSTTGFGLDNYDQWPSLALAVLILAMTIGGMTGSSTGGIKISRIYMLIAIVRKELLKAVSPNQVAPRFELVRGIDQERLLQAAAYLPLMLMVMVGSTLVFCIDGLDLYSAFTTAISMANNVGLGFGRFGPVENFYELSGLAKGVCIFLMIVGRLEYFVVLAICMPIFWEE